MRLPRSLHSSRHDIDGFDESNPYREKRTVLIKLKNWGLSPNSVEIKCYFIIYERVKANLRQRLGTVPNILDF